VTAQRRIKAIVAKGAPNTNAWWGLPEVLVDGQHLGLTMMRGDMPGRLIAHRANDLQPQKLVWVWPGRIPEGKLVLLGGPPGLGKSQLTAFMSDTVSNGGNWPCGEGSTLPGDVIFMSAEDGIQDTIVPLP